MDQCVLLTIPTPLGALRKLVLEDGTVHVLPPVPSLDENIVGQLLSHMNNQPVGKA